MSDEKVNFDGKGNYSFGEEMHEMDVNTAGGRRAGTGRSRGKVKVFSGGEPGTESKEPAKFDLQKMRDMAKKGSGTTPDEEKPQEPETPETTPTAPTPAEPEPTPALVTDESEKPKKDPLADVPTPSPIQNMVPDVALQEMGLKVKPAEEGESSGGKAVTGMNLNTLMRRSRQNAGQTSTTPTDTKEKDGATEVPETATEEPAKVQTENTVPEATVPTPTPTTETVVEPSAATEENEAKDKPSADTPAESHDFNLEKMNLETSKPSQEESSAGVPAVTHEPPKSEDGRFIVMDIVQFLRMFSDGSEQANAGLVQWIISACKLKVKQPMATVESIEYPGLKLYGLSFLSGAGSSARYMALLGHGDAISACTWNVERSTAIDCTNKITVTDICACLADTPIIAFANRNRSGVKK